MTKQQIMQANLDILMKVNSDDKVIGKVGKIDAHKGKGVLHRALTIFLLNRESKILITKRGPQKPLWPFWWDGACSTHPWYPDEDVIDAAKRRLPFELGLGIKKVKSIKNLFSYEYHATYNKSWSENEINHILLAKFDGKLDLNIDEVIGFEWVTKQEFEEKLKQADFFAPWVSLAWKNLSPYLSPNQERGAINKK